MQSIVNNSDDFTVAYGEPSAHDTPVCDLLSGSVLVSPLSMQRGVVASALGHMRRTVSSSVYPVMLTFTTAAVLTSPSLVLPDDVTETSKSSVVYSGPSSGVIRIIHRLTELESLSVGWFDGNGEAVSRDVISVAQGLTQQLSFHEIPQIRIYPTLEGGLQLEWSSSGHQVSLEIFPDLGGYAAEVDLVSGDVWEREFLRIKADDVIQIIRYGLA